MPNINKIYDTAISSISKVYDSTLSSLDEVLGLTIPASFVNSKAVQRDLTVGTSHAITFEDIDDEYNFVQSDSFSISFWVRAGWSSSLNTNIHFLIGQERNATYQLQDMIKIYFDESLNRLSFMYGNKNSKADWRRLGQWLFHANSGAYATAYAAAGLGTTFWSASNRGNANSDGYTMITITKPAVDSMSGVKLYWNGTSCGSAPIQTNQTNTFSMSTTEHRLWSLGSNGVSSGNDQKKTGNSAATRYDGLTFWDAELTSSEVSELYNSGTPMDATTHSASSNLVGFWNFEDNGTNEVGENDFSVAGNSTYVTI